MKYLDIENKRLLAAISRHSAMLGHCQLGQLLLTPNHQAFAKEKVRAASGFSPDGRFKGWYISLAKI